jgi:hypothetical protein
MKIVIATIISFIFGACLCFFIMNFYCKSHLGNLYFVSGHYLIQDNKLDEGLYFLKQSASMEHQGAHAFFIGEYAAVTDDILVPLDCDHAKSIIEMMNKWHDYGYECNLSSVIKMRCKGETGTAEELLKKCRQDK